MSRIGYSPVNFGIFESVKSSSSHNSAKGSGTFSIEKFPQIAYTYDLKKLQLVSTKNSLHPPTESFYEINFQFPQLQQTQSLRVIVGRQDGILTADLAGNGGIFWDPKASKEDQNVPIWHQMGGHRIANFLETSFLQNTRFSQSTLADIYQNFETALQEEAKAIFIRAAQEWGCKK